MKALDEARLIEIIDELEDQKSKTQTPIIAKNCDRNIEIFTEQLTRLKQHQNGHASDRG